MLSEQEKNEIIKHFESAGLEFSHTYCEEDCCDESYIIWAFDFFLTIGIAKMLCHFVVQFHHEDDDDSESSWTRKSWVSLMPLVAQIDAFDYDIDFEDGEIPTVENIKQMIVEGFIDIFQSEEDKKDEHKALIYEALEKNQTKN